MKNHYIFAYQGNKRLEVELIYEQIKGLLEEKSTIIEPYCGTAAISFYIWKYHNKDYTFILNDDNKDLINIMKTIKEDKINDLIDKINNLCFDENNNFISKEKYKEIINNTNIDSTIREFIKFKFYSIRKGMYPIEKRTKKKIKYDDYKELYDFLKSPSVLLSSTDGFEVINKYIDDEKAIILNDPPYLCTDNSIYNYNRENKNIYNEVAINKKYLNSNATIIFILEKIWIIDFIFRKWFIFNYDKKYTGYKKKHVEHLIISNKDFKK